MSDTKKTEREFDIIVYGATGFTGQLVCEYILKQYGGPSDKNSIKYAFAARNCRKLKCILDSLSTNYSNNMLNKIQLIEVDVDDDIGLRHMCSKTNVVVNLAGPYLKYGFNVVRACVEANTNYCDITGELPFVSKMQKIFGKIAEDKKIKIIHCCGFDSVPSDLSVLFVQNQSIEKFNKPCHNIRLRITHLGGGISGGTIASAVNLYKTTSKEEKKNLQNPFYLCKKEENENGKIIDVQETSQPKIGLVQYEKDVGYVTPFIMSRVNTKVVRWTNHKLSYMYGNKFKYSEGFSHKNCNFIRAFLLSFFTNFAVKLLFLSPIYWIFSKFFLPKPGEGPSREILDKSSFFADVIGDVVDVEGNQHTIVAKVGTDKGDIGYKETAKMLVECGLCIALEKDKCNKIFGVSSPASGIGDVLIRRLIDVGFTFQIISIN